MKDREDSIQTALKKVLAGPKISETEEWKAEQAARAASMDEDNARPVRKVRKDAADAMDVDGAEPSLKAKGGVGKRRGAKKPVGRVKQGAEKFEKLAKVPAKAGVSPIAFVRLHKKHKKGRKPGIREQMGIE